MAAESANETDGGGSYSCVDHPFVGFCVWRFQMLTLITIALPMFSFIYTKNNNSTFV